MNKPEPSLSHLQIVRIGDSAGVILPWELLELLQLEIGDTLSLNKTATGVALSPDDAEFDHQMSRAREIMQRHRHALSELAK